MSIRERWIVYPLLFLAILMGTRDALVPSSRQSFHSVECQELVVRNINGEPLVTLGESGDQSGMIVVFGPTATTRNLIQAASANGNTASRPLIELSGDPGGGAIRLKAADDRPTIFVGHWPEDRLSGLLALAGADALVPLGNPTGGQHWGLAPDLGRRRERRPARGVHRGRAANG